MIAKPAPASPKQMANLPKLYSCSDWANALVMSLPLQLFSAILRA